MSEEANAVEQAAEKPSERRIIIELIILSIVSLFFELLVIRWMSAEIRAFSIFKTFPLVTCFVGLGAGYALGRDKIFKYTPIAILFFVINLKISDYFHLGYLVLPSEGILSFPNKYYFSSDVWMAYVAMFMVMMIFMLMGPFGGMICLGSRLGVLFNQLPPLRAYIVNIGGSIAGSLLFSISSFAGLSPEALLIPVSLAVLWYLRDYGKVGWKALVPLAIACSLAFWKAPQPYEATVYWSPYQRIEVQAQEETVKGSDKKENIGYWLRLNRTFYQFVHNLSAEFVNRPDLSEETRKRLQTYRDHYTSPYAFIKPKQVLIFGAGTGNDVAEALRQGADCVDAVDIDPLILDLGKKLNPSHPYDDPKVNLICDDARHYMSRCKKKYDLIIFGQLDSQTGFGQGSSMRLDNYVFTSQSLANTAKLLTPTGIAWLSGGHSITWLQQRIFATIKHAVGYAPLVIPEGSLVDYASTMFIFGEPVRDHKIPLSPGMKDLGVEWEKNPPDCRILTDDWPYMWLTPIAVDVPYLLVLLEVILLAMYAGRRVLFGPSNGSDWQLFFLGAAFLLLELQAIARLALLFGSTWLTSAAVITGVLLMILLANIAALKDVMKIRSKVGLLYALLILSLVGSCFTPVESILSSTVEMWPVGPIVITIITTLPVFLAGIIFAASFAIVEVPGRALGFNLLGAVVGALLEYLSNYLGLNSLILVAAALYAISYVFYRNRAAKMGKA